MTVIPDSWAVACRCGATYGDSFRTQPQAERFERENPQCEGCDLIDRARQAAREASDTALAEALRDPMPTRTRRTGYILTRRGGPR